MDTSMSGLGKGSRTMGETMDTGRAAGGYVEKRPRGEALEIALTADLEEERSALNGGIRPSGIKLKHINLRLWAGWKAQHQHGLQMNATECWARSCRREKRSSRLN